MFSGENQRERSLKRTKPFWVNFGILFSWLISILFRDELKIELVDLTFSLVLCAPQVMPSHYTQNLGGRTVCVYKVRDYVVVLKCLKGNKNVEIEEIPWGTLNVVERLSHSFEAERWMPCRPEHFSDDKVDELIGTLPKPMLEALLPFQLDGVKFGLQRGGRCLIADEMGLGKTLQVIASMLIS